MKLTFIIIEGGNHSNHILVIESQILQVFNEGYTNTLKNKKNFSILEDEWPSNTFLNR